MGDHPRTGNTAAVVAALGTLAACGLATAFYVYYPRLNPAVLRPVAALLSLPLLAALVMGALRRFAAQKSSQEESRQEKSREDGALSSHDGWLQKFLYEHRARLWLWGVLGLISLAIMVLLFWGLQALNRWGWPAEHWFAHPGPWTLLLVAGGSPVALFVWFVRDRNKTADLRMAAQAHAQQVFEELQRWASGENDVLQAAAIHQLRPFVLGKAEGPLPESLAGPDCPFTPPALAILRALLDDRRWLKRWEANFPAEDTADAPPDDPEDEYTADAPPRSPVLLAIETLLRDPQLPIRDFSHWNLSGLHLHKVQWQQADLVAAKLIEAELFWADLSGANLSEAILLEANLARANLKETDLTGADLYKADLREADLRIAKLEGAKLKETDLTGADLYKAVLYKADLREADLSGANLKEAKLREAKLRGADLSDAELGGADLTGTDLTGALRPEDDLPGWTADEGGRLRRVAEEPPEEA